ncbi:MAG: thioredoxin family protein [Candidatus Hodarchaeota archaeon]
MALDKSQEYISDMLHKMKREIHVLVFTTLTRQGYRQCPACEDTASFVRNLAALSEKLVWDEISVEDAEKCKKYDVSRFPTILIPEFNIRYTGAPIGLEASPFFQTLLMASTGETILGNLIDEKVAAIKGGKLMVIVTPTCPYCSQAVLLENSLAIMSNGKIGVEVVEAYENPDIAKQWQVSGVPVTIINDKDKIVGVPTLQKLLGYLS